MCQARPATLWGRSPPQLGLKPAPPASGGCGLPGRGCRVPASEECWCSENSVQDKANPFLEELQQEGALPPAMKIEETPLRHENILRKPRSLILPDPLASFEGGQL